VETLGPSGYTLYFY